MAAPVLIVPVSFTILDGLIACGVDNTSVFHGSAPAERISNDVFISTFESTRDKPLKNWIMTSSRTVN